ncbi:MAG: class I SAM-dependent methyltransferase [Candidatus Tectomicrobia bacterium]|nr:class I SAM-dependent methyltransferase [Candidatus Tectomicrobia bacterium]
MDASLIENMKHINEKFGPFYPYLAKQMHETLQRARRGCGGDGRAGGAALEIGPYALGISLALAELCSDYAITIVDDEPAMLEQFRRDLAGHPRARQITITEGDKYNLPFPANSFDLIFFRGALFFWERQGRILAEIHRTLKPGGVGIAGGGFGNDAPNDLIEEHLPVLRDLNRRLYKKILAIEEVRDIIAQAGLQERARLTRKHGLWIEITKETAP